MLTDSPNRRDPFVTSRSECLGSVSRVSQAETWKNIMKGLVFLNMSLCSLNNLPDAPHNPPLKISGSLILPSLSLPCFDGGNDSYHHTKSSWFSTRPDTSHAKPARGMPVSSTQHGTDGQQGALTGSGSSRDECHQTESMLPVWTTRHQRLPSLVRAEVVRC